MRYFTIVPLGDTEPIPLTLPTQWEEVSLAQYIRLVTEPKTDPLVILTGLSPEQVGRVYEGDRLLMLGELTFLRNANELLELEPSANLPDVGSSTYGQLLLANQYAEEQEGQPEILCAPYFYALYSSHQQLGKYSEAHVGELLTATLARPVTQVYADVVFIWAAWQLSASAMLPLKTTWTTIPTTNMKLA
jgi:hypothetical protein